MSVSPDYTEFVDLSIYDKDPTDILAAAKATLQSRIPDWVPANTNVEVMLMEALAVEIGETIFSINRLPSTMMKILLALYGVEINSGTPPTTTLTFTAYDTDGYAIPLGTEVAILTGTGEYVSFFTDVEGAVVQGQTTATIAATANVNTNIANGLPSGTVGELAVALIGIDSVETGSTIVNGSFPEREEAWTERGIQRTGEPARLPCVHHRQLEQRWLRGHLHMVWERRHHHLRRAWARCRAVDHPRLHVRQRHAERLLHGRQCHQRRCLHRCPHRLGDGRQRHLLGAAG
jgi:hypothetical protein